MTAKEAIEQIKQLFAASEPATVTTEPEPEPATFEDLKTADGQIVRVEKLEVGAQVQTVTAEGLQPVMVESLELENGDVLKLTDGKITEIVVKPAEPDPVTDEQLKSQVSELETKLAAQSAEFASIKEENANLTKLVNDLTVSNANTLEIAKQTFALVEKLADLPAATPTQTPAVTSFSKTSKAEKLEKFLAETKQFNQTFKK